MKTHDTAMNAPKAQRSGISLRIFFFLALVPTLVVLIALLYIVTSRQIDIRQECQRMLWTSFPELREQQRSSVNLERLRMLGTIVYNSTDSMARRKARIEAQTLSIDAAFEKVPQVRETMEQAFDMLRQMAAVRDKQRAFRVQLYAALGRIEQNQCELAKYMVEHPGVTDVGLQHNLVISFLELLNVQDVRNAIMGEDNLRMLQVKIAGLEAQARQSDLPESLKELYTRIEQQAYLFLQAYKAYFIEEKTVAALWQEFDISLRSLSEHNTLNAALGIETILQNSIALAVDVERVTWQGFMVLCATVLLGLFLVRNCICVPLFWLLHAIDAIRDGQSTTPSPRIFINELQYLSDAITNLNYYWTGLKAHSVKLESEKHLLEGLSIKDGLTDLHNRRYFDLMLQSMWADALAMQKPVALLMMDIDHFKNYNDTLGHPKGDMCLKQLASAFQTNILRPTDKVCRYGGEEFTLLLTCINVKGPLRVAERIHNGVRRLGIEHPASQVSPLVTLSIGIACYVPEEGDSAAMLVEWADRALYAAKKAGRNRTCVCTVTRNAQGEWEEALQEVVHGSDSVA